MADDPVLLPNGELMKPGQVARVFNVHSKTVARWAKLGQLPFILTPGGHRRFRPADVRAALQRGRGS